MKYETAAAFRQALLSRLRVHSETASTSVERVRKRVAFERLLARLLTVAPDRWMLKGALALDLRLGSHDYFSFAIARSTAVDPGQPEPSARFHVTAYVAGTVFDEGIIDVGLTGVEVYAVEHVTSDLLSFAGIPPLAIPLVSVEDQLAEKVHAYTRQYGKTRGASTRVKDLVDLVQIVRSSTLDAVRLRGALDRVFRRRQTHELPAAFPTPPPEWAVPYRTLALALGMELDPRAGFERVAACLDPILSGSAKGRWNPSKQEWGT